VILLQEILVGNVKVSPYLLNIIKVNPRQTYLLGKMDFAGKKQVPKFSRSMEKLILQVTASVDNLP
jgi:hypothetical protein